MLRKHIHKCVLFLQKRSAFIILLINDSSATENYLTVMNSFESGSEMIVDEVDKSFP